MDCGVPVEGGQNFQQVPAVAELMLHAPMVSQHGSVQPFWTAHCQPATHP